MIHDTIIQLLKEIIKDEKRILTDKVDLYSYSYDSSFGLYLPDVVVQPKETKEVAEMMKLANKYEIPVYPRGQGTSLSGGPLPVKGGIVFDLSKWDNKLIIDAEDMVAVVSPGVITADINNAAMEAGMIYPPGSEQLKRFNDWW